MCCECGPLDVLVCEVILVWVFFLMLQISVLASKWEAFCIGVLLLSLNKFV